MNTQRKILIVIFIIFIIAIVGLFFGYQSFIKDGGINGTGGTLIDGGGGGSTLFPGSSLFGGDKDGTKATDGPAPVLRQVSSVPTSGGVVFNLEDETIIRYIERSSGHIFETTGDSLEQDRISNTTVPRIQKSVWSQNGDMVIFQYLDENETIKSFYGKVSEDVGTLEGWFLSNNITDIDVHTDDGIFYTQKVGSGSKGVIANFDGTNNSTVFSSSIVDWIPQWIGDSATITTKPSRDIPGFIYLILSTGYEKIISADGLITNIGPDGSKILISTSNANGTGLFIYDRSTKEATEVPFRTLANKCTWSADTTLYCASPYNEIQGAVPDDWYKGLTSFSDDIWSYNTDTEIATLVYDMEADGKVLDIINLTTDNEQKILLFTNKSDLTLWALSLNQK